ncbi:jg25346 [Pararge aegeria aegeria]|uniref:Jg25346 protein n=1 Tax=Pararge aegeria aegeria TaxID=348720 RepID=A0A8S4S2I8_9NEOP|nr:jg25346 [Pararge aegeria aegeria]
MENLDTCVDSGGATEAAETAAAEAAEAVEAAEEREARGRGRDEEAGMYSVLCASCGAVGPTCAIGRIDASGVSPPRRLADTLCCATPDVNKQL